MWGRRGALDRNVEDGEESAETEGEGDLPRLYILKVGCAMAQSMRNRSFVGPVASSHSTRKKDESKMSTPSHFKQNTEQHSGALHGV